MGYYGRRDEKRCNYGYEDAVRYVESRGYVVDEYGSFDDPDNPTRTGGYINADGQIHMNM